MSNAQHQRAFSEPAERDDPRNALLDLMARQIIEQIEAAEQNEVLDLLLRRIEDAAPKLARALVAVRQATTPAAVIFKPTEEQCAALKAAADKASAGMVEIKIDTLDLAFVLTALKTGDQFRMSRQHREMFDRAREMVRSWIGARRRPNSVACDPPRNEAVLGLWTIDAAGSCEA